MRAAMWWIDRWRQSDAFARMTAEEQGLYRNLCDEAWLRGWKLPFDEAVLRSASGDAAAWERCRSVVMSFFDVTPEGIVPHVRLYTRQMGKRRPWIPLWIQRLVFGRDGNCLFCGSSERLELDHIQRYRDGGPDTPENLRVLCKPCNLSRERKQ